MSSFGGMLEESRLKDMNIVLKDLSNKALAVAQEHGYDKDKVQIEWYADLRYKQQASELATPIPVGALTKATISLLQEAFDNEHKKTYGHCFPGNQLEAVNLRVVSRIYVPEPHPTSLVRAARASTRRDREMRKAYFGEQYGSLDTPVLFMEKIGSSPRGGPLLIDTYDSTIVVPPGCKIAAVPGGLVITIKDEEA